MTLLSARRRIRVRRMRALRPDSTRSGAARRRARGLRLARRLKDQEPAA